MHKMKQFMVILCLGVSTLAIGEALSPEQVKNDQAVSQNFSQIADLKTSIEYYRTQLDVQQLQQQLISLQGTETVSFKVLRIEGFDSIDVWLLGADGAVVRAVPGDIVFGDYRVSQVKPSEVRVMNMISGTLYTVPFAKQQDIVDATKASSAAKAIATVADKG